MPRRTRSASPRLNAEANLLLRALPASAYARLLPHLRQIELQEHDVLWEPDAPIEWVYFPRTLVASLLVPLDVGLPVEAATVGREGMIGVPIVLGSQTSSMRAIVQVSGEAVRIPASTFCLELAHDTMLLGRCLLYANSLAEQMAQSGACIGRHPIGARCARWLLMTHDRVGRDEFNLMQTFLASMLGVYRPRVTVAAGALQKKGFIRYSRGHIKVLDRVGLEGASCTCYAVLRAKYDGVLSARIA